MLGKPLSQYARGTQFLKGCSHHCLDRQRIYRSGGRSEHESVLWVSRVLVVATVTAKPVLPVNDAEVKAFGEGYV